MDCELTLLAWRSLSRFILSSYFAVANRVDDALGAASSIFKYDFQTNSQTLWTVNASKITATRQDHKEDQEAPPICLQNTDIELHSHILLTNCRYNRFLYKLSIFVARCHWPRILRKEPLSSKARCFIVRDAIDMQISRVQWKIFRGLRPSSTRSSRTGRYYSLRSYFVTFYHRRLYPSGSLALFIFPSRSRPLTFSPPLRALSFTPLDSTFYTGFSRFPRVGRGRAREREHTHERFRRDGGRRQRSTRHGRH